jgi:hypothetical protein
MQHVAKPGNLLAKDELNAGIAARVTSGCGISMRATASSASATACESGLSASPTVSKEMYSSDLPVKMRFRPAALMNVL